MRVRQSHRKALINPKPKQVRGKRMPYVLLLLMVVLCAVRPCWSQVQSAPQAVELALLESYQTLRDRGIEFANRGDYQNALAAFEQALSLARQSGKPSLEAKATFNVGLTYANLGRYKSALEALERVLEIIAQHALQEPDLRANALVNIALIHGDDDLQKKGNVDLELPIHERRKKAIDYAERVLPDLQGIRRAHILAQLGAWVVPNTSEDLQKTLRYMSEAARLYREAGDLASFANTQLGIGTLLQEAHHLDEATSAYEAALAAAEQIKHPRLSWRALRALAWIDDIRSQYQRAIARRLEALDIATRLGPREQAQILSDLATVYGHLGDHRRVIDYLKQLATIYGELGDATAHADIQRQLGMAYDSGLDDYDQAFKWFEAALQRLPSTGSEAQRADILASYASALKRSGDAAKALAFYREAFQLYRSVGQDDLAADVAGRMLLTPAVQELSESEREQLWNALLAPTRPDIAGVLRSRATLIAIAEGRLADAEKLAEEAQAAYAQRGDQDGRMRARATLGWIRELQGRYALALTDYETAIEYFESRRQSTTVPDLQMLTMGQSANIYDRAVRVALRLQDTRRAFLLSERSRARALLDRLEGLRLDLPQEAPPEARRQQQLSEDLHILSKRIADERSPEILNRLRREKEDKEREYWRLVNTPVLTAYNRRFVGQPQRAEEIQALLDEQTTLLSYFVTPEDSFAFILTRTTVEALPLGVGRDQLTQVIRASHASPHAHAWAQLSAWLLAPLRSKLRTPRLGIIPHGALHSIAFAWLAVEGDRRLIDDHILFYLPSASSLALLPDHRRITRPTFLAVSQPQGEDIRPDERFSDLTIDRIAAQFEGTLLKADAATESAVRQLAPKANVVYISAHARADRIVPAVSSIYLKKDVGSDGRLTVEELYGMTLKDTDLVVLSACETGAGDVLAGDELISLNRAFHAAGVPTVVSTLRLVDAQVSSALMEKFFAYLHAGNGKAEALALAQRSIARTQPDGADWAAFIVTGRP